MFIDYSTSVSLMTKMYEGKTEEDERKKEDNNQVNGNEYISRYYSYL